MYSQINIYKLKSSKSLRTAQEYAMDQDLTIVDLENFQDVDANSFSFNNIASNIGIEAKRVSAANKIRNIDSQIEKILELDDDIKKLQYIAAIIPSLREESLPEKLEKLERELIELRLKYTEDDKSVKLLEKEAFVKLLKERALGYLKAQELTLNL